MEPWQTIPLSAALAAFLAWAVFKLARIVQRSPLKEGAVVRLKASDAVYRTRFTGTKGNRLWFAAPLQSDRHVPIAVGERVSVEAPCPGGVVLFRSRVAARDLATHEMLLEKPHRIFKEDRRQWKRIVPEGKMAAVEGAAAHVLDFSDAGIRLLRNGALQPGERIGVLLEGEQAPKFAWVLACETHFAPREPSHCIRARFEDRISVRTP